MTQIHASPENSSGTSEQKGLRANKLGVMQIAFFVIASAAPLGAYIGGSPVLFTLVGPATPLVYVIAGLLIAVFAAGYLRMGNHIFNASGFITYISSGIGRRWAAAGAGLAVATYLALQVGFFGLYGVFARGLFAEHLGIDLPEVFWVLVTLAIVAVLTVIGVDTSFKVLAVLIVAELLVVVVLLVGFIVHHGVAVFDLSGFTADQLFTPGLGVALLFAIATFTTFEATIVFAEEAREPRKTIPRALYLVVVFVGVLYFVATWLTQGVVGVENIQEVAQADPEGFLFVLAIENVGAWLALAIQILLVTSFIAMLLGLFNMISRYLFGLGRSGFLPTALSSVANNGTPRFAVISNAVVVGVLLAIFLFSGADPWGVVYLWGTAIGTTGFVIILLFTSISVVAFFWRRRATEKGLWSTRIAPLLATLGFAFVAYLAFANFDLLSGGDPMARWLLWVLPIAAVLGLVRGLVKKDIDFTSTIL